MGTKDKYVYLSHCKRSMITYSDRHVAHKADFRGMCTKRIISRPIWLALFQMGIQQKIKKWKKEKHNKITHNDEFCCCIVCCGILGLVDFLNIAVGAGMTVVSSLKLCEEEMWKLINISKYKQSCVRLMKVRSIQDKVQYRKSH